MHRERYQAASKFTVGGISYLSLMTYKPSSQQGGHQSHLRPSPSWIGFHGSCVPFQLLSQFGSCTSLAELREGSCHCCPGAGVLGWVMEGRLTGVWGGGNECGRKQLSNTHTRMKLESLHFIYCHRPMPLYPHSGYPDI